jgi:hypothetical protein
MQGERKRVQSRSGKEKKAKPNADSIQEYDFFVTQDRGGEMQETAVADQRVKGKKKYGRGKGTDFFFSE